MELLQLPLVFLFTKQNREWAGRCIEMEENFFAESGYIGTCLASCPYGSNATRGRGANHILSPPLTVGTSGNRGEYGVWIRVEPLGTAQWAGPPRTLDQRTGHTVPPHAPGWPRGGGVALTSFAQLMVMRIILNPSLPPTHPQVSNHQPFSRITSHFRKRQMKTVVCVRMCGPGKFHRKIGGGSLFLISPHIYLFRHRMRMSNSISNRSLTPPLQEFLHDLRRDHEAVRGRRPHLDIRVGGGGTGRALRDAPERREKPG